MWASTDDMRGQRLIATAAQLLVLFRRVVFLVGGLFLQQQPARETNYFEFRLLEKTTDPDRIQGKS